MEHAWSVNDVLIKIKNEQLVNALAKNDLQEIALRRIIGDFTSRKMSFPTSTQDDLLGLQYPEIFSKKSNDGTIYQKSKEATLDEYLEILKQKADRTKKSDEKLHARI
jgi:hypothetical protein